MTRLWPASWGGGAGDVEAGREREIVRRKVGGWGFGLSCTGGGFDLGNANLYHLGISTRSNLCKFLRLTFWPTLWQSRRASFYCSDIPKQWGELEDLPDLGRSRGKTERVWLYIMRGRGTRRFSKAAGTLASMAYVSKTIDIRQDLTSISSNIVVEQKALTDSTVRRHITVIDLGHKLQMRRRKAATQWGIILL